MLNFHRRVGLLAVACGFAVLGLASGAAAATITADMVDSDYEVESGGLLFSNFFFVWEAGTDASLFTLCVEDTRVTLDGPMRVMGNDDEATFGMTFDVDVVDTSGDAGIVAASLFTPTLFLDNGSLTLMQGASAIDGNNSDVTLITLILGDTDNQEDTQAFEPDTSLSVQTVVNLRSSQAGDFVDLQSISNEFTLVPEPATAATLALGLLGLALAGSRR